MFGGTMKHFITICILLSITFSFGHAQNWPNRFYSGVQYVRCNSDTTTYDNFPWYISAVDSSFSGWENWPTHDSLQWHILPDSRLDLVNEICANLAEFTIQPARMLPSTPGEFNIVSELNDRIENRVAWGKPAIDMCITNFGLHRYIAAERLMFHPETSDDFSDRGSYSAVSELSFEDFPFNDAQLDKQIGHLGDDNNCISMNTSGEVNGLKRDRKREISFHQPHLSWAVSNNDTTAGKYHLSIVFKATEPITPTDNSAALKVSLYATDPGNPPAQQVVTFEVPGNDSPLLSQDPARRARY